MAGKDMTKAQDWQRARKPEQIAERREAILEAAVVLFEAEGMDGCGINAIARQAGISKANIYRYFDSREHVLLQLLLGEQADWIAALSQRLKRLRAKGDVTKVARIVAETLDDRPRYCILMGVLANVLEHNVGVDAVMEFKREALAQIGSALVGLETALPGLDRAASLQFLAVTVMSASGIWAHSHPSAAVEEVLQMPEFSAMRFEFKRTMQFQAEATLGALLQRS